MAFYYHYHVTMHKDIFYSVAYVWHIFMIKYIYVDNYCPYAL